MSKLAQSFGRNKKVWKKKVVAFANQISSTTTVKAGKHISIAVIAEANIQSNHKPATGAGQPAPNQRKRTMEAKKIKSEVQAFWQCPDCLENHETKSQAMTCCREVEKVFLCADCDTEHESKSQAGNCCSFWECQWCGDQFESKKEANDCCKDGE